MPSTTTYHIVKISTLFVWFVALAPFAFAQPAEDVARISHFAGKVITTHNGISLVPSFSLDKPAVLFNLSIGGPRLTFEPDIRFALEGKPWSFLFWWRYKAIQHEKFSLRVGMHPALNFRTIPLDVNGGATQIMEARRFLAGELSPTYALTKHISVGPYYLYSRGLDRSQTHTHFLVLNTAFTNLPLSKDVSISIFPNVYYLKMDALDGFYVSSTLRLAKRDFPLSLESVLNKIIRSEILPERDFVWNVSLVYSFNQQFVPYRPQF
ncbi:hypothetical protein SAMN05421823_104478 [Catalinimonas alkaloidigena]|uniref:Uncharacterized protein n=1 Tax=Catalinimonas alkaloidigena TaxID=1075417 RepID=A0A1G9HMP1_9BACT|nr:hypothetical protein [Catalinimonas alkaloidigena]SDL14056.1 hypothetical protein SAMN05421823_104478 [Catalinimonas alkaloidigena]